MHKGQHLTGWFGAGNWNCSILLISRNFACFCCSHFFRCASWFYAYVRLESKITVTDRVSCCKLLLPVGLRKDLDACMCLFIWPTPMDADDHQPPPPPNEHTTNLNWKRIHFYRFQRLSGLISLGTCSSRGCRLSVCGLNFSGTTLEEEMLVHWLGYTFLSFNKRR